MVNTDLFQKVSFWILIIEFSIYITALFIVSVINPDTAYIKNNPIKFCIELVAVPTITCIPLIMFAYFRKMGSKNTLIFVMSFWIKVFILHFLMELSGFYTWMMKSF